MLEKKDDSIVEGVDLAQVFNLDAEFLSMSEAPIEIISEPIWRDCSPNQLRKEALQHLRIELHTLGLAESTIKSYTSGLNAYLKYCSKAQTPPFPLSHVTLESFVSSISSKVSWKTIKIYLSGVQYYSTMLGHPDKIHGPPGKHGKYMGLSNAEKCRIYRAENIEDIREKDRQRKKVWRKNMKENPQLYNKYKNGEKKRKEHAKLTQNVAEEVQRLLESIDTDNLSTKQTSSDDTDFTMKEVTHEVPFGTKLLGKIPTNTSLPNKLQITDHHTQLGVKEVKESIEPGGVTTNTTIRNEIQTICDNTQFVVKEIIEEAPFQIRQSGEIPRKTTISNDIRTLNDNIRFMVEEVIEEVPFETIQSGDIPTNTTISKEIQTIGDNTQIVVKEIIEEVPFKTIQSGGIPSNTTIPNEIQTIDDFLRNCLPSREYDK